MGKLFDCSEQMGHFFVVFKKIFMFFYFLWWEQNTECFRSAPLAFPSFVQSRTLGLQSNFETLQQKLEADIYAILGSSMFYPFDFRYVMLSLNVE